MHVSGKYDWQLLPQAEPAEIKRVAQELGVTPLLATFLYSAELLMPTPGPTLPSRN
ncbi:hypothetical protein [Lacticaseibacillus pantheris]|uniref:hypothetical protein n=1 Tax=Lacticaseibacillus pantheris TaxID=171523 RepID=UPI000AD16A98|nr:hypothetical protein [Lacticaseibacillus pantheris]